MILSIGVAFIAGLVSFASPCVLPLIPGFLAYLGGASLAQAEAKRREIFLNSAFFVLGFAVVFSALGVLLGTVLQHAAGGVQLWLSRFGGAVIVLFGLYLTGLLRLPFLDQEYKLPMNVKIKSHYITSFLFGLAFAAGWTPCIGPVLGGILGLAASEPGSSFALLMIYSLGLGLPFLVVGLFAAQAAEFIKRNQSWLAYVNKAFGVLLIIIGILVFTKQLSMIANFSFINNLILK